MRLFREPTLLALVALVMLANVVPRNWAFGMRTREAMASDAAWADANRAGGLALLAAGTVWAIAAFYLPARWAKPVGALALLASMALLFWVKGWSI